MSSANSKQTVDNVTQTTAGLVASAGQLLGTNTNDSALPGNAGEERYTFTVESGNIGLTSGGSVNFASAFPDLTEGDWEIGGCLGLLITNGALVTAVIYGVSNTVNTMPASNDSYAVPTGTAEITFARYGSFTTNVIETYPIPTYNIQIVNGSTLQLNPVVTVIFTVAPVGAFGQLWARRVR